MLAAENALPQEDDPTTGNAQNGVGAIEQDQPSFYVRVSVDRESGSYAAGDQMAITVRAEIDSYLYVFYQQADNKTFQIFPNSAQPDNFVRAGQDVSIPGLDDRFRWTVGPPFGKESLKVIAREQPLQALSQPKLTAQRFNPVSTADVKAARLELDGNSPDRPADGAPQEASESPAAANPRWAEARVEIVTRPAGEAPQTGEPQRFGVFFGVSKHLFSPELEALQKKTNDVEGPDKSAAAMAEVMQRAGKLTTAQVFVNEQVTKAAIKRVITRNLAKVSKPGDTVIIYFCGHGAPVADQENGDERDGFDEFLVPYDMFSLYESNAVVERANTGDLPQPLHAWLERRRSLYRHMFGNAEPAELTQQQVQAFDNALIRAYGVTDDEVGKWLQSLDGRRVIVILETCHSGGFANLEKATDSNNVSPATQQTFDFLDLELSRLKDIGQGNTALLTSSSKDVSSRVRLIEPKLGVMCYALLQVLERDLGPLDLATATEHTRLGMREYFDSIQAAIDEYNANRKPDEPEFLTHEPILFQTSAEPMILKP
jgi:hypothetical protein